MSRELTRRQNNESTLLDEEGLMVEISQRRAKERREVEEEKGQTGG